MSEEENKSNNQEFDPVKWNNEVLTPLLENGVAVEFSQRLIEVGDASVVELMDFIREKLNLENKAEFLNRFKFIEGMLAVDAESGHIFNQVREAINYFITSENDGTRTMETFHDHLLKLNNHEEDVEEVLEEGEDFIHKRKHKKGGEGDDQGEELFGDSGHNDPLKLFDETGDINVPSEFKQTTTVIKTNDGLPFSPMVSELLKNACMAVNLPSGDLTAHTSISINHGDFVVTLEEGGDESIDTSYDEFMELVMEIPEITISVLPIKAAEAEFNIKSDNPEVPNSTEEKSEKGEDEEEETDKGKIYKEGNIEEEESEAVPKTAPKVSPKTAAPKTAAPKKTTGTTRTRKVTGAKKTTGTTRTRTRKTGGSGTKK